MKKCNKCNQIKEYDCFYKKTTGKDGYDSICKDCKKEYSLKYSREYYKKNKKEVSKRIKEYQHKNKEWLVDYQKKWKKENREKIEEWYEKNKEIIKKKNRKRYKEKKEVILKQKKEYYQKNKEIIKKKNRKYYGDNKEYFYYRNSMRRAMECMRTVKWANLKEIRKIYNECRKLNKLCGYSRYHVDHIYPLVSDIVCGLHVENNLQIITAKENHKKKNRILD